MLCEHSSSVTEMAQSPSEMEKVVKCRAQRRLDYDIGERTSKQRDDDVQPLTQRGHARKTKQNTCLFPPPSQHRKLQGPSERVEMINKFSKKGQNRW